MIMNKKWVLYSAVTTLGVVGLSLGGLYSYANQSTIPPGVSLADWKVGGLSAQEFQSQWENRKKEIWGEPIHFTFPTGEDRALPLGELPIQMDDEKTIQSILTYGKEGNFLSRAWKRWNARKGVSYPYSFTWDESALKTKIEQTWPDLLHHEPKNAKWSITTQDEVQYEPDQPANNLNIDALAKSIMSVSPADVTATPPITVPIPMMETKAKVTMEDLKTTGLERKIAEFSTNYAANAGGRTHNVEATTKVLDNTLLHPGDVFDYSKIIKDTETKYGYKEAPEIVQGKLEMGIGGGICQVSSTLYNTVLLSDLQIVERRNHSIPVGYIPMGRDATYSDDAINFKFRNNTSKDILIRSTAKDGLLTIKMFGSAPAGREIEITSQTVSVLQPPTQVIKDSSLAAGNRKVVDQGRTGYKVQVFKSIKENGILKEKVLISTDTYRAQPTIVHVGS